MNKFKMIALICATVLAMTSCAAPANNSDALPSSQSSEATINSSEATTNSSEASVASSNEPEIIKNEVTMEKQTLNLEKVDNARQIGGYLTTNGMRIKNDKILRTGKLDLATEEDLAKLKEHGLRAVIDLRTTVEITDAPDPVLPDVTQIHIKIHDESGKKETLSVPKGGVTEPGKLVVDMYLKGHLNPNMYIEVLKEPVSQAGFGDFLRFIAKESAQDGSILYHCTSGKDRVGVGTALIMSILEVDRETILDDFALTNDFNQRAIAYIQSEAKKFTDDPAVIEGVAGLTGVVREYLENALSYLDEEYGSPLKYIQDVLGVTEAEITAIRTNLLEPVA